MIKFNSPYISGLESEYLNKVITSKSIAGGGEFNDACESFFREKYGFKNCYLTPSCTAAIEMAALILQLAPNDEIIVPSFTFASCPNPFLMNGTKVVLADCDPRHPNITLKQLTGLVTENTKAVMLMHYGGVGLDIEEATDYCKQNGLYIIEDAAQCIHSYYNGKALGSFGDISVFSFHETKNINCGEGGMLVINNPAFLEQAEIVRQYGTNRTAFQKGKTDHYEWKSEGLALFLSELNAAFLFGQLLKLDEVTDQRKKLWNSYFDSLNNFTSNETFLLPEKQLFESSNCHTFFIKIQDNKLNDFVAYMAKNNVQVTKHFYPLHLTKLPNKANNVAYKNAAQLQHQLVRLPLHAYLTEENCSQIAKLILAFFDQE